SVESSSIPACPVPAKKRLQNRLPSVYGKYRIGESTQPHTFCEYIGFSIDESHLPWYSGRNYPWEGGCTMSEQSKKIPCCTGLLAHV
ncbi:MAG: hypothetical protein IKD27_01465, partial [Oscillospiraceae bacterium]|nr:hypothetical protein [Oscillospiraceae bacterium]